EAEGKPREAEALLREAAVADPSAARVHTMLGFLLSGQGRLPEALRELETAKRLSFRETEARTELGFVLLKLGREDEALTELRDGQLPTAPPLPPTCGAAAGRAIDLERPDPAAREYVTKVRERIRAHQAYPREAVARREGGELQVELQVARSGKLDCVALRRS